MTAPDFGGQQACADTDTDLFFPTESGRASDGMPAKAICARCVVRQECFDWALPRVWIEGIWGGTSGYERRQLRRALRTGVVHPSRNEPAGHKPKKAAS